MIDFNRAVKHPFEDKEWLTKGIVGALVAAVPILNFASLGWMVEHVKNVEGGADVPMPNWGDNFGAKFATGLKLALAYLVYALPIIALYCIFMFAAGGLTAMTDNTSRKGVSDAVATGFGITSIVLMCVMFAYSLVLAYLSPAIVIQFLRKGEQIAPTLRLSEVLNIARANGSDYLMTFVGPLVINFIIGLVLSVAGTIAAMTVIGLCVVIPATFLITPYLMAVMGHFTGQYARQHIAA